MPSNKSRQAASFKPDVIKNFTIQAPAELLPFVTENLPEIKRTRLKQMLAHNQIAVNGNPVSQFNHPLQPGDTVSVNFTREFQVFYNRRLKIVYEDDDILVVNKGYGLLSMGNDKVKDGTAYSILKDYLKRKDPRNKIFIIHRLDRDTSGLMMFAKNEKAKEAMQHNWNNMVLNRKYVTVVEGEVEEPHGVVRSYLGETSQFEVFSTDDPSQGKLAVTRWTRLKEGSEYSLLEVELDTGRKNQIRVHMKDIGHPISGDRKYGAEASPIHRLALHARTLRFIHPVTRREMMFETPVPSSFIRLAR
ncbi:MAG TPA: RNA pseudouridine synthase [Porphyromonadaceae bacterium]|nr:RluA family pseudouridine synthase [Paramuribaculum sp.]HAB41675.1 RNA pseudouridine synthase [Porphyromonadaceae bacterium]